VRPELSVLLKWSNGVPMDAPGMMAFVQCAGLEEINEEFFYNEDFPTLFRKYYLPLYFPSSSPASSPLSSSSSSGLHQPASFQQFFFVRLGRMKWIPIAPIDYDFCYNALDIESGYIPNLTSSPPSSSFVCFVR
jgi:hypothetical protein